MAISRDANPFPHTFIKVYPPLNLVRKHLAEYGLGGAFDTSEGHVYWFFSAKSYDERVWPPVGCLRCKYRLHVCRDCDAPLRHSQDELCTECATVETLARSIR